jgi:hypothetical protein
MSRTLSGHNISLEPVLAVESGLAKMSQRASADILLDALYGDLVLLALFGIPVKLTVAYIDSLAELVLHDATSDRKTELSPKSGGRANRFSPQRRACRRFGDAAFTRRRRPLAALSDIRLAVLSVAIDLGLFQAWHEPGMVVNRSLLPSQEDAASHPLTGNFQRLDDVVHTPGLGVRCAGTHSSSSSSRSL